VDLPLRKYVTSFHGNIQHIEWHFEIGFAVAFHELPEEYRGKAPQTLMEM
jgi:hypothetical protein